MGNNRTAKTVEKGFVESEVSQDEGTCPKTLKKTDPVLFCNLSESSVELARKVGNGSVEELVTSEGVNGHNQLNNGFLDINSEDKLLVHNNVNKNVVSVAEGNLKFTGNNGILFEEVEEGAEKGDVLHCRKPDSPKKNEVSGNGINLFVEVFGPLDEIDEGSIGEHIANGAIDPDQEHACEENRMQFRDTKSTSIKNEEEGGTVKEPECIFNVSDLVWIKTRSQLWWPGVISDPSSSAKDVTKSEKKGPFLVKYYGSANFTWCSNSDLKPFLEFFEQFSRQNDSRNFVGSVEKALGEIGRRVKLKMTCPCFSKEAAHFSTKDKGENSMPMDNASKFDEGVLSLSQFEPASFCAGLRNLARVVSIPGKVDLTVAKNRLSAFYRAIGHCQLPMQVLRPSGDTPQNAQDDLTSKVMDEGQNISGGSKDFVKGGGDVDCIATRRKKRNHRGEPESETDGKLTSSGKDHESRERKKSKYLSYPYVDDNQKLETTSTVGQHEKQHETEDSKHLSSTSEKSTLSSNSSGKNSQKRASRNSVKGHHIVSKDDNIDECSAELLTELRSIALDCFYASRSKFSDSLKRFYVSLRVFTCLDHPKIAHGIVQGHHAPSSEKCVVQKSADTEVPKEGTGTGKESSENEGVDLASVKGSVSNKFPEKDHLQGPGNGKRWKAKKKKEMPSGGLNPTNDLYLGTKTTINNSWVINFQEPCSDVPKSKTTPKKIKEVGPTSELLQFEITARLPDLNGNNPSISFENVSAGASAINQGTPVLENSKEGVVSPNIKGVDQMKSFASAINQGTPVLENSKEGVVSPNINGVDQMKSFASVSLLKDVKVTPQSIPQLNNGHGINGTLNFQNAEFTARESVSNVIGSPVHNSLQMGFLPSFVKPERKKRKRKDKTCQPASVIPDLNGVPSDTVSLGKNLSEGNHTTPEGEPRQKRRRIKSVSIESGTKGEDFGAILLLNFAPELPLPSKELLVATFSRFGLLKESQTQTLNDSSVQIFYQRTSDAQFAFRSLEKNHQFGESLVSFKFHRLAPAATTIEDHKKLRKPQPFTPVGTIKIPTRQKVTPDLAFIKQNVEMMKMTLEKAGNNLSPEMRAKLENEIKGLLSKIGSVAGSSVC